MTVPVHIQELVPLDHCSASQVVISNPLTMDFSIHTSDPSKILSPVGAAVVGWIMDSPSKPRLDLLSDKIISLY